MKKANVGMTVCRANGVWGKTWCKFDKNVWPPWMLCRGCWRRVMVTRLESVNVPCAVLGASYFLLSLVSVFTPDLGGCVGCRVSHMGIHTAIHHIVNHASLGSHFQSIFRTIVLRKTRDSWWATTRRGSWARWTRSSSAPSARPCWRTPAAQQSEWTSLFRW